MLATSAPSKLLTADDATRHCQHTDALFLCHPRGTTAGRQQTWSRMYGLRTSWALTGLRPWLASRTAWQRLAFRSSLRRQPSASPAHMCSRCDTVPSRVQSIVTTAWVMPHPVLRHESEVDPSTSHGVSADGALAGLHCHGDRLTMCRRSAHTQQATSGPASWQMQQAMRQLCRWNSCVLCCSPRYELVWNML